MVSVKELRKSIYSKLNVSAVTSLLGSGSASIYHDVAPADAAYPLVVFNEVSEAAEALSFGGHQQQPFLRQFHALAQQFLRS